MKKIYLIIFFLTLAIGIQAQSGTYTANGLEWTYQINGLEATITGTTQQSPFTGPINIPNAIVIGSISYPVTTIGDGAFMSKSNLIGQLFIPNSVKTIGRTAFSQCTGLTGSLVIPNSVTTIADMAFWGANFTGSLIIPSSITEIGKQVFTYCNFTGTLTIPSNVTTIGEDAFLGCRSLTSLNLSNGITTIERGAFEYCEGLTGALVIPNSVTTIGENAFYMCRSLTGPVTLPNNLTTLKNGIFCYCYALRGPMVLPNSLTTIEGQVFQDCYNLRGTLIIPSSVRTVKNFAFINTGLDIIKFEDNPNINFEVGNIFGMSRNLKYIDMAGLPPLITTLTREYSGYNIFGGIEPFTMVYLPGGSSIAESGQENFVIGNTCDNFVVYDNYSSTWCDYPIQHPFLATKATYSGRSFYGNSWGSPRYYTLCLPYPATLPNGMRAYELTAKTGGGSYFRFVSIGDGGTELEANKPYLVRTTDGGTHTFGTEMNVQVPVTPPTIEVPATADGTIFFGGTTVNIDNATAAAGGYYNLESNTWKPIKTDNPNGTVRSFRAYIRSTSPTPAKGFAIVLDDENETTGIDNAEEDIEKGDGKIYSLDGKLLGTDINALKSGEIYIKNGKKFYKF